MNLNDNYRNYYEENTKEYINVSFSQSPLYQIVDVEGTDVETRIVEDKNYKSNSPYEQKLMLLKPNTILKNGSYIKFYNKSTKNYETWLLMFYESNVLYPKCYIRYCNKIIRYEKNEYHCVVTSNVNLSSNIEENKLLVLPKGYLLVFVKLTEETLKTKEGQRFVIDGNSYEVQTIDIVSNTENKIGILQMNLKKVPKNNEEIQIKNTYEKNKEDNLNINEKSKQIWGGW